MSAEKLAPGSVAEQHLAEGAVNSEKISPEGVLRHHLADGVVTSGKLAPKSVMAHHLEDDSVSSRHIVPEAIGADHLSTGCVNTSALADQSVTGEKIADGSIGPEKLNFPFFPQSPMQCGTATFTIAEEERETEVIVPLNAPFSHGGYVIVAMTDRPGCWSVLRERRNDSFTLVVQREGTTGSWLEGTVFWIGMGQPEPVGEEAPIEAPTEESIASIEEEQDPMLLNTYSSEVSEAKDTEAVSMIQSVDMRDDETEGD